ncbi:MAG: hypothetical protein HQL99_15580 [Magnetococcales bacterium]|nr:hypothetical protein [Magnetococcales bacterium]
MIDLFHFIDWVLRLPKALDDQLVMEIIEFEESQKMPYISSAERFGHETGLSSCFWPIALILVT